MTPTDLTRLDAQLQRLHLHYIQSHYQALATRAAEQQRSHLDYLGSWLRARPPCGRTAASSDASGTRASPWSNPSMTSSGAGLKRSTARKSRTCSVWPSSQPTPTSS